VLTWLAFGSYDAQRHPRVAVLIEGLRARGDRVVEVNAPLGLSTAQRIALVRQPWRLPVLAYRLGRSWLRLTVAGRRRRRREHPDAVLVGYLGHFDVRLARRLFPDLPIVLDHLVSAAGTAADRGLAGAASGRDRLLRWIDRTALARADLVLVDTEAQVAQLPAGIAARALVVPVGAAEAWFTAPAAPPDPVARPGPAVPVARPGPAVPVARPGPAVPVGRPGPADRAGPVRVIFFGLFTPLHGTEAIGAALAYLAGDERLRFTMVGTGQDHARCRRLAAPNRQVTWLDWVPGERLPDLVAGHQVCLGIFGTTDKALRVVPTKVYQGLAAGCAVVTSNTPVQRQALGDAAVLVPPGDPAALAAALRGLAADPHRLAALAARGQALARARYRPVAVVEPLAARVAEVVAAAADRSKAR
jgi:glycosyltransferase involved in cell wall biosynthesis